MCVALVIDRIQEVRPPSQIITGLFYLSCPLGEMITSPKLVLVMHLPQSYHHRATFPCLTVLHNQHIATMWQQGARNHIIQVAKEMKLQLMINSINTALSSMQLSWDKQACADL